ncbi:MAG: hypothetical protein JNL05_01580 [Flavobacteriales bacterium]|nr:hypothetical protein [Flavobacteriales bacterium]
MRCTLLLLLFLLARSANAQRGLAVDPSTLPGWMVELVNGTKPAKPFKPEGKPVHTNTYLGQWTVELTSGERYAYWGSASRFLIRRFDGPFTLQEAIVVDLQANVRMNLRWGGPSVRVKVEDLVIPQAGYFRELFNDTVMPSGRSATILGNTCTELVGVNSNKDTTYYWRTNVHPALFADLQAWSSYLCREGALEYLGALMDRNAGSSLRVDWTGRTYGPRAGSILFTSITPGATPMPSLPIDTAVVVEGRFKYLNNTQIGRLPAWMRSWITDLAPDTLAAAFSPAPVDRGIPKNRFIGTLTAETTTRVIGQRDRNGKADTTMRTARYAYWADARRAVLQLDDPEDEGQLFYAVDLDADVVMAMRNEGHSYVIPKLHIADLSEVGLKEFGNGLELDFTPTGQYQTILGRKCEVHTTSERYLPYFVFPQQEVLNPVFDMRHWMIQRMGQRFKDLMVFGVADRPMPMQVNATRLTSYQLGKSAPPKVDLRYCQVRDERLRAERRRQEEVVERAVRMVEPGSHAEGSVDMDMVTDAPMEMVEAMPVEEAPGPPMRRPTLVDRARFTPRNAFTGHARWNVSILEPAPLPSRTETLRTWQVKYWATPDTSLLIVEPPKGSGASATATLMIRRSRRVMRYSLQGDSVAVAKLAHGEQSFPERYWWPDTVQAGKEKDLLGCRCSLRSARAVPVDVREAWVCPNMASIPFDIIGASGSLGMIFEDAYGMASYVDSPGMPLEVTRKLNGKLLNRVKVDEIAPGRVDPDVFKITKASLKP